MKRLINKGFTLVEAIVVIGIIAVMTALVIPVITQGDGRITQGKAYCKAFYFDTQDLMLDLKQEAESNGTVLKLVTDSYSHTATGDYYLFVLQYSDKDNTTPSLADAYCFNAGSTVLTKGVHIDIDKKEDVEAEYEDLKQRFANRTQPMDDEYGGYLYAVVDSKMRVVRTFWTTLTFDNLNNSSVNFEVSKSGYITFTAEGKTEDYPVASYPIACAETATFNLLTSTNPLIGG